MREIQALALSLGCRSEKGEETLPTQQLHSQVLNLIT